ncbi:hypothetical protein HPB58_13255 [Priestia filamentosa]|uniref:hypothetical protein n=1 Tax=Priestia filamentosa TaxID=1402861 RepID=UPI001FB1F0AB|nr:hypothetical protein [Priestia filamentosa]MED3727579.1 hypothetical protein [Priestia filamentosa]UOE58316.1 hypothetical protein HPB58_13255 [Priestia filamentosa]
MSEFEQFQLFLNQTRKRYKYCLRRFGYSSPITEKAAQRLVILLRVEEAYLNKSGLFK